MSTPFRSKLMFSALGLFLPGTGFNCFYLLGIKSFWGWIQLTSLIAGILGFLLLGTSPESSAAAWVLIVLGFIALEASWLIEHIALLNTKLNDIPKKTCSHIRGST